MAKVKVVGRELDQNLNGGAFNNTASQTIFQFGRFSVTSNFDGRTFIDYKNELSTFVRPVTLETLNLTEIESNNTFITTKNVVLNLDRSDLNTFVRYGSAYEFIRTSIQNIITKYPGSLYVSSQVQRGGNTTFYDFTYDSIKKIAKFKIPSQFTINKFGLIFNLGNESIPDENELKNLNISYNNYVIWSTQASSDNSHNIVGFTGDSLANQYVTIECTGNPFPFLSGTTTGNINFHIKPNTRKFNDFRLSISNFEKNIVSERNETDGFIFKMKDPTLLENGKILYSEKTLQWDTLDGYNIVIDNVTYKTFLERMLTIGDKYDQIKTDLISRFLTPTSLQTYDLTEEKKVKKLLRIYGAEFDQIRQFVDSLVYVNKVTYNKKNNLPDQLVGNLAKTFGWQYFQLINEQQLVENILDSTEEERNLNTDLTPAEVDIELWRRILINTNYFWKSKGTRGAIVSMFRLIGIPESFINITEYVYTVDGKINPNDVELTLNDLPSSTLPYDSNGYPIAPRETKDFYFQMSGDTDSGQAYFDVFRDVGFSLSAQIDNKKSWTQEDSVYRNHYSSPQYYQQDSKLVLNTKEIDIGLDSSRGIENDVFNYIKNIDYPANSTGSTLPFSYVNLSLDVDNPQQSTFTLPDTPEGDVEVRFNGLLLRGPNDWDGNSITSGNTEVDYYFVDEKTFKLGNTVSGDIYAKNNNNDRDVIEATYIYRQGSGLSQVTVRYIVTRITPSIQQAIIPLPEKPAGDVQLTINGIAATKGTPQFIADYIINGNNIVIQNPDLIAYFSTNPDVKVAYITVSGSSSIYARNEINRIDTLCGGKVYFNNNINRAVYRLNYRVTNAQNVKVLVDGIALEPNRDYTANPNNPYEIFLPPGINLGSVISAYYMVGESVAFDPIISDDFGLGDITKLSFLEFLELIQRRLINATNRKVITDHKGGWYPTLLKVYTTYLIRSTLDDQDPLKSNGYTFSNLYSFLSKYNAFFQIFVDQLLSSTVIIRGGGSQNNDRSSTNEPQEIRSQSGGGSIIKNTIFTKQKFTYKRGVNFDSMLNYFGDDGAVYLRRPLSQSGEWLDDNIEVDDLCDNFIVNNIRVEYPTTTTTTTNVPYNGVLLFDLISSEQPSSDNGIEKQSVSFDPPLPPEYSVNVTFNIEYELISDSSDNNVYFNTIIKNNNVEVFSEDINSNIDTSGSPTIIQTYEPTFNIDIDDSYEITMEAVATYIGGIPPVVGKIIITPTINSVIPNGNVPTTIPLNIDLQVSDVS
ncbi:MAG: hypothetical protein ACOC33_01140 [bacterium]